MVAGWDSEALIDPGLGSCANFSISSMKLFDVDRINSIAADQIVIFALCCFDFALFGNVFRDMSQKEKNGAVLSNEHMK